MKHLLFSLILIFLAAPIAFTQTVAHERAAKLGLGINLSFLENWWQGTKEKNYADFVDQKEAFKRQVKFAAIAKSGFKTVRIPINFGVWASYEKSYRWTNENGLKTADNFVEWALDNNLRAIIDLHHVELDGKNKKAATTERIVWLWREIAARYKNTDPDKVFFEIRNEPHDIEPQAWRSQAIEIIKAIRAIAPKHTLIVGFHDWNSRKALVESAPFDDKNIIYTFHYYDPFLFTHQGATWAGEGLKDVKNVPFPANADKKIEIPASAKGKWVESLISTYGNDSDAAKMYTDLKAAKDWSEKYRVPIFLGEFGSYTKNPSLEDRCRHAETIYSALGKLQIPNAWWEWDGGFNMFEKGSQQIAGCMRRAIDTYYQK